MQASYTLALACLHRWEKSAVVLLELGWRWAYYEYNLCATLVLQPA